MNLLKQKINDDNLSEGIPIHIFRQIQYDNLKYFIELAVNYLSKLGNNYLKINKISINKLTDYINIYNNYFTQIVVETTNLKKKPSENKILFKILIPTLIDNMFFVLNGNYYVPTLYIIDKPITIKRKSVKLTSTFNSISIYDKIVTFTGVNIPASYFLNLILNMDDPDEKSLATEFSYYFRIKFTNISESDLLKYFADKFRCEKDKTKIIELFELIFFDEYTKYLYQYCYDIPENEITLRNILKQAMNKTLQTTAKDFIDLTQKRIIFLEALLLPLFKRISVYAIQAYKGYLVDEIRIDQMELIKFFHNKLHSKFIYDSVNAYCGMLMYKVSMLNPGSENAPSIVADLHETHFQRICPISISNQNPGETTYLTPSVKLDYFGQFV